jgi:UDP-N-acetylmuramoylalanine--D-glutamate ligase
MILGGSDKGIPFDTMTDEVTKNNVKHAIVIGQTGPKIIELLKERGFDNVTGGMTRMEDMVDTARAIAQPGDVILLSCGCASFGLFKDYKDRGNQFKAAVNNLK